MEDWHITKKKDCLICPWFNMVDEWIAISI